MLSAVMVVGLLAACGGGAGSPTPGDATGAARAVLAQNDRFAGIGPRDPDLIGQAAWYEVAASGGGWRVTVRIGWGDCEAGCISEHRWVYGVSSSGVVSLIDERGDALPDASGIRGIATAGPTCPVVTDPPDPGCADRPVAGAVILVLAMDGSEVGRVVTGADGSFGVELAPGAYRVVPQPVEGLMGTAAEQAIRVEAGAPAEVTISYDTGIR